MVEIEYDKLNYTITIEVPETYWTITTIDGTKVEYENNGNN